MSSVGSVGARLYVPVQLTPVEAAEKPKQGKDVEVVKVKATGEKGDDPNSFRYEVTLRLNKIPNGAKLVELYIVTNRAWKQGSVDVADKVTLDAWIHRANKMNNAYVEFFDGKGNSIGKSGEFKIVRPD